MGLHRCKRGFGWCKRLLGDLCSLGPKESKGPFAPSPNHFRRLSLFGQFLRSTASQGTVFYGEIGNHIWMASAHRCANISRHSIAKRKLGPATAQNLVVKFDGEICGGVLVENASDDFPSKSSSKICCQTSPEVRHKFRRKLRQLHSGGNCWCLENRLLANLRCSFPPP